MHGDEPIVFRGSKRVLHDSRPMIVTRFVPSSWNDDADLLDDLFSWYNVYEIVESPSLIRPIAKSNLIVGNHGGNILGAQGNIGLVLSTLPLNLETSQNDKGLKSPRVTQIRISIRERTFQV